MKTIKLKNEVLEQFEKRIKLQLSKGNKYHVHYERKERLKDLIINDIELLHGYIVLKDDEKTYQVVDKDNYIYICDGDRMFKLITLFKATKNRVKRLEDVRVK